MELTTLAKNLEPGNVLVGDAGGHSQINGNIDPSNLIMGALAVETEHGTLYIDPDEQVTIIVEMGS